MRRQQCRAPLAVCALPVLVLVIITIFGVYNRSVSRQHASADTASFSHMAFAARLRIARPKAATSAPDPGLRPRITATSETARRLPTRAPVALPTRPPPAGVLISSSAVVTASTNGNLGAAQVIIGNKPHPDWLADRWQCAKDMSGAPMQLPQYVQLDLRVACPRGCHLTQIYLDWETAYGARYVIQASNDVLRTGTDIADFVDLVRVDVRANHGAAGLRQEELPVDGDARHRQHTIAEELLYAESRRAKKPDALVRHVRVVIEENGTRWGASLWRLNVHGVPA